MVTTTPLPLAACNGLDPRLWDIDFPGLWPAGAAICLDHCPSTVPCRTAAVGSRAHTGVFGGAAIEEGVVLWDAASHPDLPVITDGGAGCAPRTEPNREGGSPPATQPTPTT